MAACRRALPKPDVLLSAPIETETYFHFHIHQRSVGNAASWRKADWRLQEFVSIAGVGLRWHCCEQLLSGLGNGSRLLHSARLGGKT